MQDDAPGKTEVIQSVSLAMQILETLAEARSDMGVTALADSLGTTKSRIYRHLRTLVTLGYIGQSPITERYRIGSRLIALGRSASDSADLAGVAKPFMHQLRDATEQAVSLSQVEDEGIRILNTVSGTLPIEVGVRPGSLLGFANSAQGKIALSLMDLARRDAVLEKEKIVATDFTITEPASLRAHLELVAQQGWATAPNESMLGLNALASPIFDADKALVGTIAIVGLTQHILTPPDDSQINAVRQAARGISLALGYPKD